MSRRDEIVKAAFEQHGRCCQYYTHDFEFILAGNQVWDAAIEEVRKEISTLFKEEQDDMFDYGNNFALKQVLHRLDSLTEVKK